MGTSYIYKRDASRLFIAVRENGKRYKLLHPERIEAGHQRSGNGHDFVEQEDFHYAFDYNKKHVSIANWFLRDQNKAIINVNGVEYKYSLESIFSYVRRGMINSDANKINENNIIAPMPEKLSISFLMKVIW